MPMLRSVARNLIYARGVRKKSEHSKRGKKETTKRPRAVYTKLRATPRNRHPVSGDIMKAQPHSPFRQRRPAQCRLESAESVAFRQALYEANMEEVRSEHERDKEAFEMVSSAGFDPWSLDMDALIAVSNLEGTVTLDGEVLLVIVPSDPCADHMALDRTICGAGLTRYVRHVLPSDRPIPGVDFGEFVLVQELSKGLRHRVPVTLR